MSTDARLTFTSFHSVWILFFFLFVILPSSCLRAVVRCMFTNPAQHRGGTIQGTPRRGHQEDLNTKSHDDLILRCLHGYSCTVTADKLVSKTGSEVRDESEFLLHYQVNEASGKLESSDSDATGDATLINNSTMKENHDNGKEDDIKKEMQMKIEIKIAQDEEIRRLSLVEIPLDDSFEDQAITHIRVPLPGYDIDGTPAYFVREEIELEEREKARWRRIKRFMGGAKVGIENDEEARRSASKRRRSVPAEYCNTDRRDVPRFCAICLSKISIGERVTWSSNSECTHIFHTDCIQQWLSALGKKNVKSLSSPPTKEQLLRGLDCPCCRQPFVSSSIDINDIEEKSLTVGEENV